MESKQATAPVSMVLFCLVGFVVIVGMGLLGAALAKGQKSA